MCELKKLQFIFHEDVCIVSVSKYILLLLIKVRLDGVCCFEFIDISVIPSLFIIISKPYLTYN